MAGSDLVAGEEREAGCDARATKAALGEGREATLGKHGGHMGVMPGEAWLGLSGATRRAVAKDLLQPGG
jgi:hypothetical protein